MGITIRSTLVLLTAMNEFINCKVLEHLACNINKRLTINLQISCLYFMQVQLCITNHRVTTKSIFSGINNKLTKEVKRNLKMLNVKLEKRF